MEEEFKKARQLIDSSQSILLTMHERMDGDDGGSLLALGQYLESLGKHIVYVIKFGVAPQLKFLPHSEKITSEVPNENFDLLISCGCSTRGRIGIQKIISLTVPTLNIDHHPDNTGFGTVNLVDSKKSSVAELVYDFFVWNKWPINKNIATCLLTGIVTDTGSFMHSNTQSSTLKVAAALMRKGAQTNKIVKHTYQSKDLGTLKAWGKAIENSYYDKENKIIYSILSEKDLRDLGELPQSAFEGLAETLNKVPEAKFAMFIRQDGNIIKGSLRSEVYKHTDVSKIAQMFGGGGHKQAAGFSVARQACKRHQRELENRIGNKKPSFKNFG